MFDNVGGKCKTLAKVICWLGIIGTIAEGIFLIMNGNEMNHDYYPRSSGTNIIIIGVMMLIIGPIFSWLASLALYAIGESAETGKYLVEQFTKSTSEEHTPLVAKTTPVQSAAENHTYWKCPECGIVNPPSASFCKQCRTYKVPKNQER